jgi:hypothetical protein
LFSDRTSATTQTQCTVLSVFSLNIAACRASTFLKRADFICEFLAFSLALAQSRPVSDLQCAPQPVMTERRTLLHSCLGTFTPTWYIGSVVLFLHRTRRSPLTRGSKPLPPPSVPLAVANRPLCILGDG